MSDSLEALQAEYGQTCAKIGELSYQIHVYQAEIAKLFGQLKKLNQQGAKIQERLAKNAKINEAAAKAKAAMKAQEELPFEAPSEAPETAVL